VQTDNKSASHLYSAAYHVSSSIMISAATVHHRHERFTEIY